MTGTALAIVSQELMVRGYDPDAYHMIGLKIAGP